VPQECRPDPEILFTWILYTRSDIPDIMTHTMDLVTCPFCTPGTSEIILENDLSYTRYDKYPASPGHLLVLTKRHIPSVFDANRRELDTLWELLNNAKHYLDDQFSPDGYNIGINDGVSAGQTIPHLHIHLIPRYIGDTPDPRGGVRGVIPDKQKY
ncbi:MAG: HIT family protein, partial [Methanobacteriota archaeon]